MPSVKDIIVRKPSEQEKQRCQQWPIWSCPVSEFEWEYTQTEKCLLIEGRVQVKDNPPADTVMTFAAGDYVVFPNGLKCIWSIEKDVKKYYDFE